MCIRDSRYDEVGLFSGMLFCADCGHVMYQQRYPTDKRKPDCYICGSSKKRTADCTAHFLSLIHIYGPTKIARMLTEQEIPTPGTLEYQRTGSIRPVSYTHLDVYKRQPFILGLFAPRIYIPFHIKSKELDSIIAHERAVSYTHLV